jgi:ribonuclease T2
MFAFAAPAATEGIPGAFDFYVLALSWTNEPCPSGNAHCGTGNRFQVHGLWPQYEAGYPLSCPTGLSLSVPSTALDIVAHLMPRSLARHEWRVHGTCSGLIADAYFDLTRRAFERVAIPGSFAGPQAPPRAAPNQIEDAFVAANPGLLPRGMSVQCSERTLTEVRVCMTRSLEFRPCSEVDADTCASSSVAVGAN